MDTLTEMLKGLLEGCILEIISREQTYGYEITKKLNELGFTDVVEGTVYAILLRLEKKNIVNVNKKPSELGPERKFYELSESGIEYLRMFWQKWDFISSKINLLRSDNR